MLAAPGAAVHPDYRPQSPPAGWARSASGGHFAAHRFDLDQVVCGHLRRTMDCRNVARGARVRPCRV